MIPSDPPQSYDLSELIVSISYCMRTLDRPPAHGSNYISNYRIPTVLVAGRRMVYRSDWEKHLAALEAKKATAP